jgi:chorismate mutase/prephenate dehydratase
MTSIDKRLLPLRDKIDQIDKDLLQLLTARANVAIEVGKIKHETGAPIFRPERERQVIDALSSANLGPLKANSIAAIWREIMSGCRAIEAVQKVAYLGPSGTFSEEAAFKVFGQSVESLPCISIDEVFRCVETGNAEFGVVPIENSSEGAISRTLDLLLESSLNIVGEIAIPVRHHLLSQSGTLDEVELVVAHPQALAQCQNWLNQHVSKLHREAVASNAEGAKQASKNSKIAAIAGENAQTTYGLQVVASEIQDDAHNRTRFVVIGKTSCEPTGHDQTSIVLSVPNEPGAVYKMLSPLAKHEVSMSRLESRPARKGTWEYHFFIDVEGHRSDPKVEKALAELQVNSAFYKCLGSYAKSTA